jgi:hypothetical protein
MGCIGGWNCNPTTIDQWPGPLGNSTLLVGGVAPLVNNGIAGWTGTALRWEMVVVTAYADKAVLY